MCFLLLTFERAAEARVSKALDDGYGDIGNWHTCHHTWIDVLVESIGRTDVLDYLYFRQ